MVLLAGALAVVVSSVSHFLAPRYAARAFVADQQLAIFEHRPFVEPSGQAGDVPEFRNRVLVPAALELATRAGHLPPVTAYFGIRVGCAFAMFLLLGAYVSRHAPAHALLPALAVVALALIISFNHPYEFPSDYLDIFFTTLFVMAARTRARVLALVAAAIGATGRESAAFSGVIWWFCADDAFGARTVFSIALVAVAMGVTTALRAYFHLPGGSILNSIAIRGSVGSLTRTFVTDPQPRIWVLGLFVIGILLYQWLRTARSWSAPDWALLRSAVVIFVITLVFGVIHELRIYMPVVACVVLAGIPASRPARAA